MTQGIPSDERRDAAADDIEYLDKVIVADIKATTNPVARKQKQRLYYRVRSKLNSK